MPNITRRAFGALSASALLSSALPGLAQARGRVIVGTWGGDYQSLQQANIVDTVLKDSGLQVVFDPAAETVRKSKILAERRLPRGTMDVACLTRQGTYEMYANGALEEPRRDKNSQSCKGSSLPSDQVFRASHVYWARHSLQSEGG